MKILQLLLIVAAAFGIGYASTPADQTARGAAVGYSCGYIHAGDDAMKRDRKPDRICDAMRKNAIEVGAFPASYADMVPE